MDWLFPVTLALTGALGFGMTLWGLWYVGMGLMALRKPTDFGRRLPRARFAVLIAARNEELVIGPLINSLLAQNYPPELYDIWVIPNNCTDNTARAARGFGARVLECTVPVKSKGEVLRFAYRRLRGRAYDAWCVFDADNLAHPDFLAEMNCAWLAGAGAAQGYRDSKNPHDTPLSGCSSLYYWMMDRFHNGGRAGAGLSAMITGTGFMVSDRVLRKLGGWNSATISEDLELTAQCVMAGERVWWVPKAITYDEQPLTWAESLKQRRRWSSGTLQVAGIYLPIVWKRMGEQPGLTLMDLGVTLLIPLYQVAALASLACNALAAVLGGATPFQSLLAALAVLVIQVGSAALTATLAAVAIMATERKWDRRMVPALATYWLFLLSWLPITVASFWKRTTVWEEIRHTRNVTPEALAR